MSGAKCKEVDCDLASVEKILAWNDTLTWIEMQGHPKLHATTKQNRNGAPENSIPHRFLRKSGWRCVEWHHNFCHLVLANHLMVMSPALELARPMKTPTVAGRATDSSKCGRK